MKNTFEITGQVVDVVAGTIFPGKVSVKEGRILSVKACSEASSQYILPGLVDAHVHIESSMLVPSEFARLAVMHGTTATVSDPHEIANVLGMDGVRFMISNGELTPFRFHFGAPSCVPATGFETAGAVIDADDVESLLESSEIFYLSEMMNFPGVIHGDPEVLQKLALARKYGKPVDGHAPGLDAAGIAAYAAAGISTDHECTDLAEALEKIKAGMHILIREGSAARNFDALIPLLAQHPDKVMFCSDDKHPDDLVAGHINLLVKRALQAGYDPMAAIRACTLNPVKHYSLNCGLLQEGDAADFVTISNLADFTVLRTFINGVQMAESGRTLLPSAEFEVINHFKACPVKEADLLVKASGGKMNVMEAFDGDLVTGSFLAEPCLADGNAVSNISDDILKLVVINRYKPSKPAVAFIRGFGFTKGAMAGTVAHDSHNLICVGTSDADMVRVINSLIGCKGGIAVTDGEITEVMALPVAGLMASGDGFETASKYEQLNRRAASLGGKLKAPFMTLSFMALLVIPRLKLSDQGLFDGTTFRFSPLFEV
jgi:adenine deaminase